MSAPPAPARPPAARERAAPRHFFSGTATHPIHVERLAAAQGGGAGTPVVLVHGACHSGLCYLATPDGREGWAGRFAAAGREVYVVDWPGRGRSPACPDLALLSTRDIAASLAVLLEAVGPAVLLVHSASGPMAWWLAERLRGPVAAVIAVAAGAPANLVPLLPDDPAAVAALSHDVSLGCPVMQPEERPVVVDDGFIRSYWTNAPRFPQAAYGQYRLTVVPESARLFNERFNIGGRGLRIDDPAALAGLPMLVTAGDHDPRHPRSIDEATARYLGADFLWLADEGLSGNGHMPMLEDNSDAIADRLLHWLEGKGL